MLDGFFRYIECEWMEDDAGSGGGNRKQTGRYLSNTMITMMVMALAVELAVNPNKDYCTFSIFVHDIPIDGDGKCDTYSQELLYWYQQNRKLQIAVSN